MEMEMMKNAIRLRKDCREARKKILTDYDNFKDRSIASIYHMPSQGYGLFIKELIEEHYPSLYNYSKIKVCTHCHNQSSQLKQIKKNDDCFHYVLVDYEISAGEVSIYKIPRDIVHKFLNSKPDHGNILKHSGEFTASIKRNILEEYKVYI